MVRKFSFNRITFAVEPSSRKNKQLMATFKDGSVVHFGDPKMKEFPGTKRGDNFCARSSGIPNRNNIKSANFLSRKILWKCQGKKSKKTFRGAGVSLL